MRAFNTSFLNTGKFYSTKNPTIQIRFPTAWPDYYTGYSESEVGLNPATRPFVGLTGAQQIGIRLALSMWSNYVSVTFTDAEADGKKISFGTTPLSVSGIGYYPVWDSKPALQGDVFFNSIDVDGRSFTPTTGGSASTEGRSNFWLALHEIGHALGLDHDQSGGRNGGADLPAGEDNQLFTVMSYNQYAPTSGRRPITPMLYDIAQLQDKYGKKTTYNDNQYHVEQFRSSDGKVLLDSQVQALVQAMAAFAPPPAGQTTLSASYAAALNPVIAANWH